MNICSGNSVKSFLLPSRNKKPLPDNMMIVESKPLTIISP